MLCKFFVALMASLLAASTANAHFVWVDLKPAGSDGAARKFTSANSPNRASRT